MDAVPVVLVVRVTSPMRTTAPGTTGRPSAPERTVKVTLVGGGPGDGAGAAGSVCGVLGVLWWGLDMLGTRATLLSIAAIAVALASIYAILKLSSGV